MSIIRPDYGTIINILVYNVAMFYTPITFVQHLDNKEQGGGGAHPPPCHGITGEARHLSSVICSQNPYKSL